MTAETARVVEESITHLAAAGPNVYTRGGALVRIVCDQTPGVITRESNAPTIRLHTPATLDVELSRSVVYKRERRGQSGGAQLETCSPPMRVLAALLETGEWPGLRCLDRVASAPILRADGTVACRPGYDARSRTVVAYEGGFDVSEPLQRSVAVLACDDLLDVVRDFPWQQKADQSAWLALVLTLLARSAISGPVPMWTVTANVRGAGKSRLVDVAAIIATGRTAARATQPADDAEAGKVITSIVMAGDEIVLLDNVDRALGGAKLDALLTGERWKDRLLGTNTTIDLPIRTVVCATGNNLDFRGDTLRRVLPVRLDSPLERPEDRTDFIQSDLLGYVRGHRLELVRVALTMLRAWFVAGRPQVADVRRWGSYEAWSGLVPHVLAWVGLPDPQLTREGLEADDPRMRALGVVMEHWHRLEQTCGSVSGITIRQALDKLYQDWSSSTRRRVRRAARGPGDPCAGARRPACFRHGARPRVSSRAPPRLRWPPPRGSGRWPRERGALGGAVMLREGCEGCEGRVQLRARERGEFPILLTRQQPSHDSHDSHPGLDDRKKETDHG